MRFQANVKAPVALETIAFADIVINLFVFFFITFGLFASFDVARKGILPIQLPKALYAQAAETAKPLAVMIERDGSLRVGIRAASLAALEDLVNRELSMREDQNIRLQADRSIPLERFVSVLDVLRHTKAQAVAIETDLSR